jgi:hypothetical protein
MAHSRTGRRNTQSPPKTCNYSVCFSGPGEDDARMLEGSGRKELILDKCRKLKKYLASESQVGLSPYWQVLAAIEKHARRAAESELSTVDQELLQLFWLLQERDREEGVGIINAERWLRLFTSDDVA